MKQLHNFIIERLKLTSKSKQYEPFQIVDKDLDLDITIKLPFDIEIADINETATIVEIKKTKNEYNETVWAFYENDDELDEKWRVMTLSAGGVRNLFIKKANKNIGFAPLISYVNGKHLGKRKHIKLCEDVLIKESTEETKTYVNMILLNHDEDKVLVLRRANYMKKYPGMWGFPGGSLDPKDKNNIDGAARELQEETGIELTFNEKRKAKKFDTITNKDGSVSEYYKAILETEELPEIKISKEHSKYNWFDEKTKGNYKWMPDVFQLIQKIL